MNWYVEQHGISQGPLSELEMQGRVRANEANGETLIWHPGLEEWRALGELKPEWLKLVTVMQARGEAIEKRPATRPLAPSVAMPEAKKPGLFGRLFGKKK